MTEVIHHDSDSGAGAGLLVGGLMLVAIVFLLLIYGIPAVTNQRGSLGVGGGEVPSVTIPNVNVTVPNVNVQPPQQ